MWESYDKTSTYKTTTNTLSPTFGQQSSYQNSLSKKNPTSPWESCRTSKVLKSCLTSRSYEKAWQIINGTKTETQFKLNSTNMFLWLDISCIYLNITIVLLLNSSFSHPLFSWLVLQSSLATVRSLGLGRLKDLWLWTQKSPWTWGLVRYGTNKQKSTFETT